MPRPTDPALDWASDTTYPAGADSWSATPTKITPSAGAVAAGFAPATKPPAQWINAILSRLGAWARYVDELTAEETIVIPPAAFARWGGTTLVDGFADYDLDGPILNFPAGVDCWAEVDLAPYLPRDAEINRIRWTGSLNDALDSVSLSRWRRSRGDTLPPTTELETVIGIRTGTLGGFDLTSSTVWTPLAGGVNTLRLRTTSANAQPLAIFDVEVRFTRVT